MAKINNFLRNIFSNAIRIFLLLITLVITFIIIFFIYRYISMSNSGIPKIFEDHTKHFKVTFETSFRTEDIGDVINGMGTILYKLYLEGDTLKYIFDDYDRNEIIFMSLLDKEGFKIGEKQLKLSEFVRKLGKDKITGFVKRDNLTWIKYKNYKKIDKIDVAWNCTFKER